MKRRPKRYRPQQRIVNRDGEPPRLRQLEEVTRLWNQRSGRPPVTRGIITQALKSARTKIARAVLADPELCQLLGLNDDDQEHRHL